MRAVFVFGGLLGLGTAAQAAETITYTYDALGRLVQVSRAGTVNNGAAATYTYDPANNRTNVTTTAGGGGGMALKRNPPSSISTKLSAGAAIGSHRK